MKQFHNRTMKKLCALFLICFLSMITTGCWDSVPINEHGFVLGIAFDAMEPEKGDGYSITFQVAQPDPEKKEGTKTKDITVEAPSLAMAVSLLAGRTNRVLSFDHLQVVIISETLAEKSIQPLFDFLFRQLGVRSKIVTFLADESAKDMLKLEAEGENSMATFLVGLVNGSADEFSDMVWQLSPLEMFNHLQSHTAFVMQRFKIVDEQVRPNGMGIFTYNQMVGHMDETEMLNLKLLSNKLNNGTVVIPIHEILLLAGQDDIPPRDMPYGDAVFSLHNSATRWDVVMNDDGISFTIRIDASASLDELHTNYLPVVDEAFIGAAEEAIAIKLTKDCEAYLQKCRDDWNADVLGLGAYLSETQRRWWKLHGGEWETWYAQTDFHIPIKVTFIDTGLINGREIVK